MPYSSRVAGPADAFSHVAEAAAAAAAAGPAATTGDGRGGTATEPVRVLRRRHLDTAGGRGGVLCPL